MNAALLNYLLLPTIVMSISCSLSPEELLPAGHPVPSRVLTPTPYQVFLDQGLTENDLPKSFDWRRVNGTRFTTRVGNQMLPSPCGSCWAFASSGALSDRVLIAGGGALSDINLSPQALLDCGAPNAGSCHGGSAVLAYEFVAEHGLTDETCLPYKGMDYSNWAESPCDQRMCRWCDRFGNCKFITTTPEPAKVHVAEHGVVTGVAAMKAEIMARGPIACSMYAHSDIFENYSGGIIRDITRYNGTTHVVAVVGWGFDDVPYWVVRNSFGTSWGELGWYRVESGKNIYNMEEHACAWAVPLQADVARLLKRSTPLP